MNAWANINAIIKRETAIRQCYTNRQTADDCLRHRRCVVLRHRGMVGRVPLVDDAVVADDEEGLGVRGGEAISDAVKRARRYPLTFWR